MKIRNGFVSNSSSSSFVILLPKNYELDFSKLRYADEASNIYGKIYDSLESALSDWYYTTKEEVINLFKKLKIDKNVWQEDAGFDALIEILDEFSIGSVETGPDGGEIILADVKKIEEILNES